MTQTEPQPMLDGEAGRVSAMLVYGAYLLSIPSAALFAVVGVVIAYVTRAEAAGNARLHLDRAIALFWSAAWWNIGFAVLFCIGIVLTVILIGIPIMWVAGIGWFVVMVWFTIMSLLGLIKLLDGRGP
jgi:uncharacterized membrane protein